MLAQSGTRQLILGHLSRENNRPALAYRAVAAALEGTQTSLCVAPAAERMTVEVEEREARSVFGCAEVTP